LSIMTALGCRPFDRYIRSATPPRIPDGDCGPSLDDDGAAFFEEEFAAGDFVLDKDANDEVATLAPLPVHYQLKAALGKEEEDCSFDTDSEDVPKEQTGGLVRHLCIKDRLGVYVVDSTVDSIGIIQPEMTLNPVRDALCELHSGTECTTDFDFDNYGFAIASPIASGPIEPPLWPISSYNVDCDNGTYIPWCKPSPPMNRGKYPKHVYFAGSPAHSIHRSEYSVPPYCEVYGEHPSFRVWP